MKSPSLLYYCLSSFLVQFEQNHKCVTRLCVLVVFLLVNISSSSSLKEFESLSVVAFLLRITILLSGADMQYSSCKVWHLGKATAQSAHILKICSSLFTAGDK